MSRSMERQENVLHDVFLCGRLSDDQRNETPDAWKDLSKQTLVRACVPILGGDHPCPQALLGVAFHSSSTIRGRSPGRYGPSGDGGS